VVCIETILLFARSLFYKFSAKCDLQLRGQLVIFAQFPLSKSVANVGNKCEFGKSEFLKQKFLKRER
jgi:hypothetical protein